MDIRPVCMLLQERIAGSELVVEDEHPFSVVIACWSSVKVVSVVVVVTLPSTVLRLCPKSHLGQ